MRGRGPAPGSRLHVFLRRGFFQVCRRLSFIFSAMKPRFFRRVQMGKPDGSSLGVERSIIGGWSVDLFRSGYAGCGEAG